MPRSAHLIASLGGHLELLEALRPVLAERDIRRTWVTSEGSRAQHLRDTGERVRTLPRLDRSSVSPQSLIAGIALALRERPQLVVTSGAGLAVPFSLVARALGARVIFLETMARVSSGSATGRLLSRLAVGTVVQWPELRSQYPAARVCRPLLLDGIGTNADTAGPGGGTFVTTGSHDQPFTRLLDAVEDAAARGRLPTPVLVQAGAGADRAAADDVRRIAYLSPGEFAEAVAQAELVVTHGGAGAIATVLRSGKRPVVMARRAADGEHVDDHQRELVDKLADLDLVVAVERAIEADAVGAARRPVTLPAELLDRPAVTDEFRRLLLNSGLSRGRRP